VRTFNKHTNIIGLLKHVKNRRQKAAINRSKANKLKTLNNVNSNNLKALVLERRARAIESRVLSYQNKFPSNFATYPNMVQWLLDQRAKEKKERENKIKSNENYKKQKRNLLTPNEQRIFNLIIGNTKPRNASINKKWYSNYEYGYHGTPGYQREPLTGKELINYKIEVAKRLHANPNEPKKNETSRETFNRLFPGMPSYQ
jgi:hypothetical protein